MSKSNGRPFDRNAARPGDLVFLPNGEKGWLVGLTKANLVAVECDNFGDVCVYRPDQLRMAPRKRTIYVVVREGGNCGHWLSTEDAANRLALEYVGDSLVIPVEIEV